MQIRPKADMSREEAIMLLEVAQVENDSLRQQLAEAHATIARMVAELEAIGAGGVSARRITDDGALAALQACERTYHQMIIHGTPDAGHAHDKARAAFWRVFGALEA
ncbi:hypothetical protein ACSBPU_13100 [Parapusillimonas sp. JC17]|uniref:hypothetical protein n=1 Tax=Parapusillimonas sp. JC17 TaxID=3445768 RepID=UPI003F9F4F61